MSKLLEEVNLITGNEGTNKINQFFTVKRSIKVLEMAKSGKRNAKNIDLESTLSTPTINITCSNQANILHFEDVHKAIYLNGLIICNVLSIDEAIIVLIASYWVFEIAFDPRL
nr:uncharacterized protein LOC124806707 [Hydra vulgaris]XP_047123772.1 uncharacterized protein LOC124806707 [Hydra vulgaris]